MSDEYKLVEIEWLDSFGFSADWESLEDVQEWQPVEIQSVGWLVRDDGKVKILVPHMGKAGNEKAATTGGALVIPVEAIVSVVDLKRDHSGAKRKGKL